MSESFPQRQARLRRGFDRAAEHYDHYAAIQQDIAEQLLTRLSFIHLQPQCVLDLGAGTGFSTQQLQQSYPEAQVIAVDFSQAMLLQARHANTIPNAVAADIFCLPLANDSVDLVFSSSTLQWCEPLELVLEEIARILRPDGLLMFSSYGPDTLQELRDAQQVAGIQYGVNTFRDMHPIGDLLLAQGYRDPVLDTERLDVSYASVEQLMRELRGIGSSRMEIGEEPNMTRQQWQSVREAYPVDEDGRIHTTYEIIYGHALAAPEATLAPSPEDNVHPLKHWP